MWEEILGPVLGIVIGTSFVYFMLSIVCSSIQELIAALGRWRWKKLEEALVLMLGEARKGEFLGHPLVKAMGKQPAYIPARTFAQAIFDIYAPARDGVLTPARLQAALKNEVAQCDEGCGRALLALVSGGRGASGVARNAAEIKAWLEQLEDSPAREGAARAIEAALSLEEVRGIAAQLPPSGVRTAVEEWLDGEAAQLAAARRDVETWFDDAMQRVTDTYKRRIQWFLYVIATVVVLVAGADSFRLIGNLHSDAALRAQLTAAATAVAGEPMTTTVDAETGLAVVEVNAATMATIEEAFVRLEGSLGYADIVTFDGAGRPVWNLPGDPLAALAKMVLKAMGLLLTVAAVALGAPFWFDVLKRLANLRAVGLPPGQGHPGSGG